MNAKRLTWIVNHYLLLAYAAVLLAIRPFLSRLDFSHPLAVAFNVALYLSHGLLYLLPAIVLVKLMQAALAPRRGQDWSPGRIWLLFGMTILLTSATVLILYADTLLFHLYNFHINGFVWNLLTTEGGIASLGGEANTTLTVTALSAGIVVLAALLLALLTRMAGSSPARSAPFRLLLGAGVALYAAQAVAYGLSGVTAYTPILTANSAFPFYAETGLRGLAKSMGYKIARASDLKVHSSGNNLHYPLQPLQVEPPAHPPNIVWLVSESWRADTLQPDIMPATSEFASQVHRYTQHYSGSNGTRMGIFSMFYGLYSSYWFPFLDHQTGPVLIDVLKQQNYQFGLYTSAKFTYPEFDRTVFSKLPKDLLHEDPDGRGWERDRRNVNRLLDFMDHRDQSRPFMAFMFFESPHAPYNFPDELAVRKPYAPTLNYATLNVERDIDLIHNRYINACHHLDTQFARVFDYLHQQDLLKDTIVIVTGDHGEEFLEKGRWGHNSEFSEEQTRPPLLLWVPGTGSGVHDFMTSHLDIPATLLPLLGVKNPAEDYSLGYDLLGDKHRTYSVFGDWSRVGYVDADMKATFPFRTSGSLDQQLTTRNDAPLSDADRSAMMASHRGVFAQVLKDLAKFRSR